MEFREFLLLEHRLYLGQRIGTIMNAIDELGGDSKAIGARNLTKYSEKIVNQIRRILHSNWPKEERKHLKSLQKVGVALMKAIEEKDNLDEVLASAKSEINGLLKKMKVPLNKIGVPEGGDDQQDTDKKSTDKPENTPVDKQSPPASPEPPGGLPPDPMAGGQPGVPGTEPQPGIGVSPPPGMGM